MHTFRYVFTTVIFSLALISTANAEQANEPSEMWPSLKQAYFNDRHIREQADDLLELEAPKRAEDAAIVPLCIYAKQAQTTAHYIQNLHIFIDNNPMPYSANFTLSPTMQQLDIATRVRVDSYTHIRAIAEMNDGSLHMVSRFVKASGGCSAPAGKDQAAAIERLGKMQIRMRQAEIGQTTQAQIIVSHPNNSGLQMDLKTRGYIPAHYVKTMQVMFNETPLIKLDAGISISEDPSIRFRFTPLIAGVLTAKVVDSKGDIFIHEKEI